MESGEFIPSGEDDPSPVDAPLDPWGPEGKPGMLGALILPVFFIAATWSVDRFTRSALGDWRYIPVVVLGACAFSFSVMAVIIFAAFHIDDFHGDRPPRRLTRVLSTVFGSKILFALLGAVAVGLEVFRAVHDHSGVDVVSALLFAGAFGFTILATRAPDMPRGRWRLYPVGGLLLSVWLLAVDQFHLR